MTFESYADKLQIFERGLIEVLRYGRVGKDQVSRLKVLVLETCARGEGYRGGT